MNPRLDFYPYNRDDLDHGVVDHLHHDDHHDHGDLQSDQNHSEHDLLTFDRPSLDASPFDLVGYDHVHRIDPDTDCNRRFEPNNRRDPSGVAVAVAEIRMEAAEPQTTDNEVEGQNVG